MRERRVLVNVRLSVSRLREVDRFAFERGVSRSEAVRQMLGYACQECESIPKVTK